ncbi:MAG TPA: hypothetical protein EYP31_06615, partial [Roseibacterium sp.]|nr:hypothetical protein [Roseibacterium sp.]
ILCGSKAMRFRFVEENRAAVPTKRLCRIMNVSSRGYAEGIPRGFRATDKGRAFVLKFFDGRL